MLEAHHITAAAKRKGSYALPEQFDRASCAPVSCLALSWSAAAFLGAAEARLVALQAAR